MKVIEGYSDYLVTDRGLVWSTKSHKFLTPSISSAGYASVCLTADDGSLSRLYVHRLVALSYIPQTVGKPTVDHIDRDRLNNNVSNLRWADWDEQAANSAKRGRSPSIQLGRKRDKVVRKGRKLTPQDVLDIRSSNETQCTLAIRYRVSQALISKVARKVAWSLVTDKGE